MGNINESPCDNNQHQPAYRKTQAITEFYKNGFWKFIGYILLLVTYDEKGCELWGVTQIYCKDKHTCLIYR